jgi:UDP-glucose 4-epimerase
MRILITGGLGYFGSWLTEHFASRSHEVEVLSRRNSDSSLPPGVPVIQADLRDLAGLKEALSSRDPYDVCIHAGSSNDQFLPGYPEDALLVNSLGTRNLAEVLCSCSIRRIIYFSTFHVYGRTSGEIHEELHPAPIRDYGTTHYFGEIYLSQFARSNSIPSTVLRITNGYGAPKQIDSTKWYLVHNDLTKMAFEKQKIQLQSNGLSQRDFIWMGDVCTVVESLLKRSSPELFEVFNLGSGVCLSMLEVASRIKSAYLQSYGREIPIEVNSDDHSVPQQPPLVSCAKLRSQVQYHAHDHMVAEAQQIFKLLERA